MIHAGLETKGREPCMGRDARWDGRGCSLIPLFMQHECMVSLAGTCSFLSYTSMFIIIQVNLTLFPSQVLWAVGCGMWGNPSIRLAASRVHSPLTFHNYS